MLTINADEHPVMHRFHKPGGEKRSVVVLDDDAWLRADREEHVRGFCAAWQGEAQDFPYPAPCASLRFPESAFGRGTDIGWRAAASTDFPNATVDGPPGISPSQRSAPCVACQSLAS